MSIIQIAQDDGLPHSICEICLEQLNAAYQFKNKLERSDTILKTYIMRKNTIKEEYGHDFQYSLANIKPEITIMEEESDTIEANDQLNENNLYNEIDNYEGDKYSNSGTCSSNNKKNQKEADIVFDIAAAKNEQGRYNCQFCDKTLIDAQGLKLHLRLHTGLNLKRCTICSKGLYHDMFILLR